VYFERIDAIDRSYYAVANGDGQTTAARDAAIDVGGGPRPAAQCSAPILHAAVYRNRRRIRGTRGLRLLRLRGERLERPFAHHIAHIGVRRTVFTTG
jgi:hypothetical protein